MANIMDYLDWRGDVPMSLSPFNEVDNLIFSCFSFIDLSGIVSSSPSDAGLTLSEAAEQYFKKFPSDEPLGLIVPLPTRVLIRRMAECARYRSMRLRGFVSNIDEGEQTQFAAMTVEMNERELYVVYRGTDDTLIGWKENFNMSFLAAVPAQRSAVAYLNEVGASLPHARIFVGGHSKGGNLAVYAAINCQKDMRSRIVRVYSNDGPGYRREVIDSPEYRAMASRILNIVPQSSVVGRLLEHGTRCRIVSSTATGLWQHDGFSWEVKGNSFIPAPRLTVGSKTLDRSLKNWISAMSDEQRERVVDALYQVLTSTNAKTLTDLANDRNWFFHLMSKSSPESRKLLMSSLTQLTGETGRQWLESVLRMQKTAAMKKRLENEKKKRLAEQRRALARQRAALRAKGPKTERSAQEIVRYEYVQTKRAIAHLVGNLVSGSKKKR